MKWVKKVGRELRSSQHFEGILEKGVLEIGIENMGFES